MAGTIPTSTSSNEQPQQRRPHREIRSAYIGIKFVLDLQREAELVPDEEENRTIIERVALALKNQATENASARAVFKKFTNNDTESMPDVKWDEMLQFLTTQWHLPPRFHHHWRTLVRKQVCGHDYNLPTSLTFDQFSVVWLMFLRRVRDALCGSRISRRRSIGKFTGASKFETLYEKVQELGEGSYGSCFLIEDKRTKMKRVAKMIDYKNKSIPHEELDRELEVLKELDHVRIVRVYECYKTEDMFTLIIDYAAGGDMKMYIREHCGMCALGGISIGFTSSIVQQCLDALVYMHFSKQVVHRDLKPANILLLTSPNEPPQIALCDFGLATMFSSVDSLQGHCQGTLAYMAPEVFNGDWSVRSDIWSLGICTFEFLTATRPFVADNPMALYQLVCKGNGIDWEKHVNFNTPEDCRAAMKFAQFLLAHDAKDRPDARSAREHAWIQRPQSLDLTKSAKEELSLNLRQSTRASHFSKTVLACIVAGAPVDALRKMSDGFRLLDKTGSGIIPCAELATTLEDVMGYSHEEATVIALSLDTDMSGNVDYSEFLTGALNVHKKRIDSLMINAFSIFDVNNDGELSYEELRQALQGNESSLTPMKDIMPDGMNLRDLLEQMDVDKNGVVGYEEFRQFIRKDLERTAKEVVGDKFSFDSSGDHLSSADARLLIHDTDVISCGMEDADQSSPNARSLRTPAAVPVCPANPAATPSISRSSATPPLPASPASLHAPREKEAREMRLPFMEHEYKPLYRRFQEMRPCSPIGMYQAVGPVAGSNQTKNIPRISIPSISTIPDQEPRVPETHAAAARRKYSGANSGRDTMPLSDNIGENRSARFTAPAPEKGRGHPDNQNLKVSLLSSSDSPFINKRGAANAHGEEEWYDDGADIHKNLPVSESEDLSHVEPPAQHASFGLCQEHTFFTNGSAERGELNYGTGDTVLNIGADGKPRYPELFISTYGTAPPPDTNPGDTMLNIGGGATGELNYGAGDTVLNISADGKPRYPELFISTHGTAPPPDPNAGDTMRDKRTITGSTKEDAAASHHQAGGCFSFNKLRSLEERIRGLETIDAIRGANETLRETRQRDFENKQAVDLENEVWKQRALEERLDRLEEKSRHARDETMHIFDERIRHLEEKKQSPQENMRL